MRWSDVINNSHPLSFKTKVILPSGEKKQTVYNEACVKLLMNKKKQNEGQRPSQWFLSCSCTRDKGRGWHTHNKHHALFMWLSELKQAYETKPDMKRHGEPEWEIRTVLSSGRCAQFHFWTDLVAFLIRARREDGKTGSRWSKKAVIARRKSVMHDILLQW